MTRHIRDHTHKGLLYYISPAHTIRLQHAASAFYSHSRFYLLLLLGDSEPSLLLLPRLRRLSRSPELRLRVRPPPPDDARRLLPLSPLRLRARGELSRLLRSLLGDFLFRSLLLLLLRDFRRLRSSLLVDLLLRSLLLLLVRLRDLRFLPLLLLLLRDLFPLPPPRLLLRLFLRFGLGDLDFLLFLLPTSPSSSPSSASPLPTDLLLRRSSLLPPLFLLFSLSDSRLFFPSFFFSNSAMLMVFLLGYYFVSITQELKEQKNVQRNTRPLITNANLFLLRSKTRSQWIIFGLLPSR